MHCCASPRGGKADGSMASSKENVAPDAAAPSVAKTAASAPAIVVDATYAHSEFFRPALAKCAAELGWELTDGGGLGATNQPDFVYLPPHASRFAFARSADRGQTSTPPPTRQRSFAGWPWS